MAIKFWLILIYIVYFCTAQKKTVNNDLGFYFEPYEKGNGSITKYKSFFPSFYLYTVFNPGNFMFDNETQILTFNYFLIDNIENKSNLSLEMKNLIFQSFSNSTLIATYTSKENNEKISNLFFNFWKNDIFINFSYPLCPIETENISCLVNLTKETEYQYFSMQRALMDYQSIYGNLFLFIGCLISIYGSLIHRITFIFYLVILFFSLGKELTEQIKSLQNDTISFPLSATAVLLGSFFGYWLKREIKLIKIVNGFLFGKSLWLLLQEYIIPIIGFKKLNFLFSYILLYICGAIGGATWYILKKNKFTFIISSSTIGAIMMVSGFNIIIGGTYYAPFATIINEGNRVKYTKDVCLGYFGFFCVWAVLSFIVQSYFRKLKDYAKKNNQSQQSTVYEATLMSDSKLSEVKTLNIYPVDKSDEDDVNEEDDDEDDVLSYNNRDNRDTKMSEENDEYRDDYRNNERSNDKDSDRNDEEDDEEDDLEDN